MKYKTTARHLSLFSVGWNPSTQSQPVFLMFILLWAPSTTMSSKCLFSSCFPIIFPVPCILHEQVRHTCTNTLKELLPQTKLFLWPLFYKVYTGNIYPPGSVLFRLSIIIKIKKYIYIYIYTMLLKVLINWCLSFTCGVVHIILTVTVVDGV